MDEFGNCNSESENKTEFIFQNMQHTCVPDSNDGSYPSAQVIIYLSTLSNSEKFFYVQSSYITVPLVMTTVLTSSTTTSAENAYMTSLKNGFHNLIYSMSLEITNCQL